MISLFKRILSRKRRLLTVNRLRLTVVIFFIVLGLPLPVWAEPEGKISFKTGEGVGLRLSIPFGPSGGLRVKNVIDGDTIELEDGRLVRYIGMDTPEVRRRVGKRWAYDPEPFAQEATALNRKLVQGKKVRLEFDQQKTDRFGRVLAYVFVKMGPLEPAFYDGQVFIDSHEIFVNAYLLKEGVARLLVVPPNTRYAKHLEKVEEEAREAKRNLWTGSDSTQGGIHAGKR